MTLEGGKWRRASEEAEARAAAEKVSVFVVERDGPAFGRVIFLKF